MGRSVDQTIKSLKSTSQYFVETYRRVGQNIRVYSSNRSRIRKIIYNRYYFDDSEVEKIDRFL